MASSVRLIESGPEFFLALEKLIGLAKTEIHFQTYRIVEDETGEMIAAALKRAGEKGVNIFLLLDAYGSGNLSAGFIQNLKDAGIHVRFFSPLFTFQNGFFGRRLHHKIAVADGEFALIGGINISNNYFGSETDRPWLDYALWLDGPVCQKMEAICSENWGKKLLPPVKLIHRSKAPGQQVSDLTKIIHNDWFRYKNQVDNRYRQAVREAQQSILIVASYFLPGRRFRLALAQVPKRGVKVRLLLAGRSDVPFLRFASHHLYRFLLRNGVEIYEWKESVLHAKVMLIDENWCTLGSFNLNYLSTYGSIETNVESTEPHLVSELGQKLEQVLAGSEQITLADFEKKASWTIRLRNWLAYLLMRRAFLIMTFFTFKHWGKTTFRE